MKDEGFKKDITFVTDRERAGNDITASFEFIYNFQSRNDFSERMAAGWIDTLLVIYTDLGEMYDEGPPWDVTRLRALAREQTTQSRKLLEKLADARELSPDYIEPSLDIHYLAGHLLDHDADRVGLRLLAEHGIKYATRLLEGKGILNTPLRTTEDASFNVEKVTMQREYFKTLLQQLK
jgi:hypothetical protein